MKLKLITTLLIISLLALLQGCAGNRTVSEGDLLYSIMKTKSFSNGFYRGELKDGFPHGKGTITYSNGEKYVGEWKNNTLNGNGTYTYPDGASYVGEWKTGDYNGKGTYTWADGQKYVGEWKNGKKNGKATLTMANGDKYVGEFKNDKSHGKGAYTFRNGDKYVGEFKNGWKTGKGTHTWASGDKYSGTFDMARLETITSYLSKGVAKGVYTYADGRKYEGEIKILSPHGKGTMTFPDGKVQSGIWSDGKYLYDLAEQQEREKQKREAQLAAKKQRILSKLKPYMDDCQNIGFKVDSKKYRECIVESI